MIYESYRYLWPPRPETAAPPALIPFYARRGWTAQVKKNGTCTVIFAKGDAVIFRTRHNDEHKAWKPTQAHVEFFAGLERWNVYVAELLHSKGPSLKNHLYLFDILVSDGADLTGETFQRRSDILRDRFPAPAADICGSRAGIGARFITTDVSLADPVPHDALLWGQASTSWTALGELDEGFVFKNPKARLDPCITPTANNAWQVKVRRPHTNYSF